MDDLQEDVAIALCDPPIPFLTKEDAVLSFGNNISNMLRGLPPENSNTEAGKTGKPGGGYQSFNITWCQGHR